jgi:hypothetical protein
VLGHVPQCRFGSPARGNVAEEPHPA